MKFIVRKTWMSQHRRHWKMITLLYPTCVSRFEIEIQFSSHILTQFLSVYWRNSPYLKNLLNALNLRLQFMIWRENYRFMSYEAPRECQAARRLKLVKNYTLWFDEKTCGQRHARLTLDFQTWKFNFPHIFLSGLAASSVYQFLLKTFYLSFMD